MTRRSAADQTCAFEHRRGCAAWSPSARLSGTLLQRRWPALMQVRTARSNSLALRVASARCSLANRCRFIFLSGRCVRSKIGRSPSPQPSLLRGPAVFERFRRWARSCWATPRQPVRRSRPDTSCRLRAAEHVLLCTWQDLVALSLRLWQRSRRLTTSRPRPLHEGVRLVNVA